jgi:hypothetical protein
MSTRGEAEAASDDLWTLVELRKAYEVAKAKEVDALISGLVSMNTR